MNPLHDLRSLAAELAGALRIHPDGTVTVTDAATFRAQLVDRLVEAAIFAPDDAVKDAARWAVWEAGHALGVHSASIQGLYAARGQGKWTGFTVPAVNIRGLTYETAPLRALVGFGHVLEEDLGRMSRREPAEAVRLAPARIAGRERLSTHV